MTSNVIEVMERYFFLQNNRTVMKKIHAFAGGALAVVALIIVLAITTQGNPAGGNVTKTLHVSGYGEIMDQPDEALIRISVITQALNANDAVSLNAEKMNDVIEGIKALGIKEEDIKTTGYSVYPRYTYPENGEPRIVGYEARNTIEVRTNDFSLIGKIIDTATERGANSIEGIDFHFSREKYDRLYNQALEIAVKNAQKKAETIAETAGLGTIYPVRIEVQEYYYPLPVPRPMTAIAEKATTPVIPGEEKVSARVSIVYGFM